MSHAEAIATAQRDAVDAYVELQITGATATITHELEEARAQAGAASQSLMAANRKIETLESDLTSARAAATRSDEAARNAIAAKTEADLQRSLAEASLAAANDRIAELEKKLEDLPGEVEKFRLAFEDQFTGDLSKWNVRDNFATADMARAMRKNAVVRDGQLHLLGTWLPTPVAGGPRGTFTHDTAYLDHRNLTSSGITKPVHNSRMWGAWEIRCKLPIGENTRGVLAAFWLRSDNHGLEIDLLEGWGGGGPMAADWTKYTKGTGTTTIHSSTTKSTVNGKAYRKTFWRLFEYGVPRDLDSVFHTFRFERTPEYMAKIVDDRELFRITPDSPDPVNKKDSKVNPSGTCAWMWDPDFGGSPLHVRMNMHIGASAEHWGDPDPANRSWTKDPLDFAVDYVKIYDLA